MLDKSALCKLIPHAGDMCLLEAVLDWDADSIRCQAVSHQDAGNPLRGEAGLHALTGVEYAAQAMAIHGGLLAGESSPPRQGYLAAVRDLDLHVQRLDTLPAPLTIEAERLMGEGDSILYQFALHAAGVCVLAGRASVFFVREEPQ